MASVESGFTGMQKRQVPQVLTGRGPVKLVVQDTRVLVLYARQSFVEVVRNPSVSDEDPMADSPRI